MHNSLGVYLKRFVIFQVTAVVKYFSKYYRKIHESMLKSFVEIWFEICSIYEAQWAEEKSLLKFTALL